MNIKALAALVGTSSVSLSHGQSFDQMVGAGAQYSRQARSFQHTDYGTLNDAQKRARRGAAPICARTIDCAKPPKESGLSALRFYTGVGVAPSSKVQADDTAAQLNDYRRAYFADAKFHYDAWSCDTQDYRFTFDTASLLLPAPSDKSWPVKGHARIETRGGVDWEGDLDCVANF
ncbi:MAG: hypothetical protein ACHQ2Z_05690 [Elusimicrobiota bacterium]